MGKRTKFLLLYYVNNSGLRQFLTGVECLKKSSLYGCFTHIKSLKEENDFGLIYGAHVITYLAMYPSDKS